MRKLLFAAGVAMLALAPFGRGGPVEGTAWSYKEIPGGTVQGGTVTEPGCLNYNKTFAAGQRACVVVIGDHDPVVDVEIKIYDEKNQLVALDRGQGQAKDFAAVVWYPPRQQTYRIEVCSYGKDFNKCSIAFK